MESRSNKRTAIWRPYEDLQPARPTKRMRIFFTDAHRNHMERIHDQKTQDVIKQQLKKDLTIKRDEIQEHLRKHAKPTRLQQRLGTSPAVRHPIPSMLTNTATTWINTTPISHPVVTKTTHPAAPWIPFQPTTEKTSPSEPLVESFDLESVILVPFFRVPDRSSEEFNEDGYRYVSAAKYLGFYRISDRDD